MRPGQTVTMNRSRTFRYDPSRPEFQTTLYDDYREMRDHHPLHRDPVTGTYALSRFADVWTAVHDHATFSSIVPESEGINTQLIFFDPPEHTAARALVSRAFTPRRVMEFEPVIRAMATDLLASIDADTRCEAQHAFAAVLPSLVIARMIGVPAELVPEFRTHTESFLEITGSEDFLTAAMAIHSMFAELLERRRARPAEDMMSALIAAELDGERLSEEQLLGFCMLLILAGNDTTSSLIGNGLVLLARHPEQRAQLVADESLWPAAIEEMLRFESPVQALARRTTRPVELHGVEVPAESRVMLVWGAANHDDREFDDPERFDIHRRVTRHLALGHGVHHCLGANLARLEARVAFEQWHRRFPDYELDEEPTRITSIWARAHSRVPLRLG
ncbi:MAG: cytochrome P450 [Actinobacteria bacterium]|nr:cytochrome P450 [Actinomycetota bacterium]